MKRLNKVLQITIFLTGIVALGSCSQNKTSEAESEDHDHSEMAEEENHDEGGHDEMSENNHHDDEASDTMEDSKLWQPSTEGSALSDFHFIAGKIENINPEVKQDANGNNQLELNADGTPTAFVFHNTFGNVGMVAKLNTKSFKGSVKLIHHAKSLTTYEFVAIEAGKMKLGRVVDGKEQVFNEGTYSANDGWIALRVSAAGSHFKGYIGDKTITHGHGDKMEDGYAGILVEGTGKLQIESIEVVLLEDE